MSIETDAASRSSRMAPTADDTELCGYLRSKMQQSIALAGGMTHLCTTASGRAKVIDICAMEAATFRTAAASEAYQITLSNLRELWNALKLIREAVEQAAPPGSVPNAEYLEPSPGHEAEAIVKGIAAICGAPAADDRDQLLFDICSLLELPRTDLGGYCTDIAAYEQAIKDLSHVPPAELARQEEARKMLARLHNEGILSEGQAAKATGLGRIELRQLCDELKLEGDSADKIGRADTDEQRRRRDLALIRFTHQCDMEGEENGTGYLLAESVLKRFEAEEAEGKQP